VAYCGRGHNCFLPPLKPTAISFWTIQKHLPFSEIFTTNYLNSLQNKRKTGLICRGMPQYQYPTIVLMKAPALHCSTVGRSMFGHRTNMGKHGHCAFINCEESIDSDEARPSFSQTIFFNLCFFSFLPVF